MNLTENQKIVLEICENSPTDWVNPLEHFADRDSDNRAKRNAFDQLVKKGLLVRMPGVGLYRFCKPQEISLCQKNFVRIV